MMKRRMPGDGCWKYCVAIAVLSLAPPAGAGQYKNFSVAIYIPVGVVQRFEEPGRLEREWARIRSQLKVDKVYVEVQRDRNVASDALLERVKQFFVDQGVEVAGGMALSDGSNGGQFRSFCYTNPDDRKFIQSAAELAARHFDEVIQDDFFFVTTKSDSDIAAKGDRTWTQFRLDLLRDAAENLLIKPAKAVNPKVKMVIKYPNWYEHFQGLGYDLEVEPKLFDGIYTGTETRDPETTDQNLQQYESYQIFRYFENIKPGGNGGGWVDTYSIRYVDRYAEQLWDTLFAKAPEITLFEWSAMGRPIQPGERGDWQKLATSFNYDQLLASYQPPANAAAAAGSSAPVGASGDRDRRRGFGPDFVVDPSRPTMARVAGYALEQVDPLLDKLGQPIGIACYKPYHSWGEDFLHNYLGNIGIPIDLRPAFPEDASVVLLTESAKFDPQIVERIKRQLVAGKNVIITSGLLRALSGHGIEDVVEVDVTDRKILATDYLAGYGAGAGASLEGGAHPQIMFPDVRFLTNDSWPIIRALAGGRGYPLLLSNRYSNGVLYIWTIPDNFNDLYRLPTAVTTAIKNYVMAGFPVRLDGPSQVALFAYDNDTLIVQSFRPDEVEVTVSLLDRSTTKLRNLVTQASLNPQPLPPEPDRRDFRRRRGPQLERRTTFRLTIPPHSYAAFAAEK
jgi:hypothetical protein